MGYILFPVVSTYYGGWLVAAVRSGSDLSSMITSLIGQAQDENDSQLRFPMWTLLCVYAVFSLCGLVSWGVIVSRRISLRSTDIRSSVDDKKVQSSDVESVSNEGAAPLATKVKRQLIGLACPWSLFRPVMLATLSQIAQWGLIMSIGEIGASMTDPVSCSGEVSKQVYRASLTLSNVLVPVGSILSSFVACPRWLYAGISAVQVCATLVVCDAAFGFMRSFWTTQLGQTVYIASFGLVGGLEGYLLTMAYRYIGDADNVSPALKLSASRLLSFLGVVAVNPIALALGYLVSAEVIGCHGQ